MCSPLEVHLLRGSSGWPELREFIDQAASCFMAEKILNLRGRSDPISLESLIEIKLKLDEN
jgi:hypothetical protein